jgi:hypothetical protein
MKVPGKMSLTHTSCGTVLARLSTVRTLFCLRVAGPQPFSPQSPDSLLQMDCQVATGGDTEKQTI